MQVNPKTVGASQESVVDAVLSASRVLVAIAARSLADAGEDVTLTQYRSLVVLASRGPQSMADAGRCGRRYPRRPHHACAIDWSRRGWFVRRTDRHDRRQVRIALTEIGSTPRRRRHRSPAPGDRRPARRPIPTRTQRSVAVALTQLAKSAGEVPEQDWSTGWDL